MSDTTYVLTHPTMPGRKVTTTVPDGGRLSLQWERSGWVVESTLPGRDAPAFPVVTSINGQSGDVMLPFLVILPYNAPRPDHLAAGSVAWLGGVAGSPPAGWLTGELWFRDAP